MCFLPGFHSRNAKKHCKHHCFWLDGRRGVEPTTSGLQATRGGFKSNSTKELANPAPGIFLAKARGTPASIANFREYTLGTQSMALGKELEKSLVKKGANAMVPFGHLEMPTSPSKVLETYRQRLAPCHCPEVQRRKTQKESQILVSPKACRRKTPETLTRHLLVLIWNMSSRHSGRKANFDWNPDPVANLPGSLCADLPRPE